MIFSFPPHIQAGIASGGYEIVTSKSGVALGIARDVATKRFVAHAIGTTVNPLFSLSELAIGGVQLIQTHRGFQRTFDMLTSLQHSVGVLQATTAVIGVSSIIGTAIAGVNLYQTLQLRREVKELKREIQDGFIAVLEQIDNLPDRVKFDNHRTILALAYGQFTEAVCLLELALAIEDNDARNITLGNAQNLLANALNAYSRPELFHEIHAPARLRRLECIWAMQSALALNFQLLKAPQAAIKTLTNLQQRIQQDAIAVIDACQSEAELDFLYPEISYIRAHDLPVLETWQNSIDWFQGLPESEREQLLALEIPQQQQPKEQQPLEVLEYDRLKEKSHYEALRDALKMSLQPQMRRNYEDYISDRVSRSQLQGLNSSNWQPISDLTVANLYHYFKAKGREAIVDCIGYPKPYLGEQSITMSSAQNYDWNEVRAAFEHIWGYPDFRPPQGEIVRCLLEGKDALVVLATGGGKSICFQLPALLQTGLTLVISPLVALMENQVQELQQRQLPAATLHGELPRRTRKQILRSLEQQQLRLLYLSPETLLSPPVWERLCQPEISINGLILDEAHCLVAWGDTFRPAYRRLGAVRPALLQHKPPKTKIAIAAFTATADPDAQAIIQRTLGLRQPQKFLYSPYRPNLNLTVRQVWTPRARKQKMVEFVEKHRKQAGLVYVRSRRDCDKLAQTFASLGYETKAYHGGLGAAQRREIEQLWLSDTIQFVVCTCAFGMGINKSNCRWVVHYQAPLILAEYIQEVGRGGRDGQTAEALTLVSEPTGFLDPEDKQRQRFFLDQLRQQYRQANQLAREIPQQGEVQEISRQYSQGAIALSLLHSLGQLKWLDPFHYQRLENGTKPHLPPALQHSQEMTRYLYTKGCRWQFLLHAFGFTNEAIDFRCGHCDNCRGKN